jgi:PadR family transcriptional regulator, regulatory protein PadR
MLRGEEEPVRRRDVEGYARHDGAGTLVAGDDHGHTIAKVIERTSEDVLEVEQGSLYPALHRLEDRGWVSSNWGASENNRKAKFYRLTAAGKKQLVRETNRRRQMARAIGLIMGEETLGRWRCRMSWLRFFRRKRSQAELLEEIDVYLAEEIAENVARGMSPEEARRRARIKLGNPQRVGESLCNKTPSRQSTTSGVT